MGTIREPQKSNSIEKKNKIILAGLKLFSEKGYNKTTTPLIAKEAGVSTGIVYQYFKDKKDILLYAINLYFEQGYSVFLEKLKVIKQGFDLDKLLREIIEISIISHKKNSLAHAEMLAMSHIDKEVHDLFVSGEHKVIHIIMEELNRLGFKKEGLCEIVHIAYNMVESLCHGIVFDKHDDIDYNKMIEQTINAIKYMLEN